MISTQYIKLNMVPNGIPPVLYCSQYDVGRPLGLVVYNGSDTVNLSTYTCTIEATRTDRTPITAAVTTSGNIGVFTTTPTMTNEVDGYGAKLVLHDSGGNRVASLVFIMLITKRTMDENAESIEEDASLYQQYTATVQTIIAQIRSDLVAEANARQAADQTLQQNINAEASARQSADNTLQSNINAEASTRATQDASLQSQIDQLVAPSGEAPSAAEVENARIGSDGTVYPTLGDAIRTQNSLLKSQIDPIAAVAVDTMLPIARYPDLPFEIGNISFYATGWTYSSNTKRVRTPEGKGFRVEVGDVISLTSYTNARFYFGIYGDDGVYHNTGWNTEDKRCNYAGTCVILVSNITEVAQTNVSDLASLVKVYKYHTLPVKVNNVSEHAVQLGKDSLNNFTVLTHAEIPFEYGDFILSDNAVVYRNSTQILRTLQNFTVHLSVGDKIYLADSTNAQFSATVVTESLIDTYGFRSTDLDITVDGEYLIRLRYSDTSTIYDPIALTRLLRINRVSSADQKIDVINSALSTPHYVYDIYPIKGISHRGVQYNAPENTMPAFKLSVTAGFKYIETDVQFTSDNVPVLIHDTTVDRTTDGTGNVSSFTFAQIEQLDAGSWFSAEFAGTKIPSLEEFLIFCKRTGVYPYLELKYEATYTQAQVNIIIDMLRHYNMLNSVSWISWSNDWLNMVLSKDKTARIGRAKNTDINSGGVTALNAFKTGYNRVFWLYSMSASDITLTDTGIGLAKAADQDIEISVISTEADMNTILNALTKSGYISGCLSNGTVNFADVVKARALS